MVEGKFIELGVAAIIVIMILREVMPFLTKSNRDGNGGSVLLADHIEDMRTDIKSLSSLWTKDMKQTIIRIDDMTENLHTMHNVKDGDGVPVWYVKKSHEKALGNLDKGINALTVEIREMNAKLEAIEKAARACRKPTPFETQK